MTNDCAKLKFNLSKNIKHYRKLRKLTQFELSVQANVSERYIKMLEKGVSTPSMAVLLMLANALNVEAYMLIK